MQSRLLYQAQPLGSAEEANPADLRSIMKSAIWVWLDVMDHSEAEIRALAADLRLDPLVLEDVYDIELLPKYEDHGDHLYAVLHSLTTENDDIDTTEVDCVLKDNLLITMHAVPLVGLDSLWELTERHPMAVRCADASVLLARLAEIIGRRYLEVVVTVDRHITELNELALNVDPAVLFEVQQLRRDEATIRMMLAPQRQMLASMELDDTPLLSDAARRRFGSAFDVHNQVVESLSTARALLNDTLDTYRGASAEKLNEVTRVLTVYAAIMLPLSIVVGFFGMNFQNLPGTSSENGWIVVTALMAIFGLGSWIFFAKRGYVGGPSLRSASRKVTKRLVAVARTEVRPIHFVRKEQAENK